MANIDVTRVSSSDPMSFSVAVRQSGSGSEHAVTASRSDLERLSRPDETPEAFIERCFDFLLRREPKEAILSEFDISVIGTYFSDFESKISE